MKIYDKKLAYPYFVWMVLFTVVPLFIVVYYAMTDAEGNFTLNNLTSISGYGSVFARSLLLALIATVICLVIAFPVGYFLSRLRVNKQHIMLMLVMLPMWMNFLLRTYAWMGLLSVNGPVNTLLGFIGLGPYTMLNTSGAVVLGMVYNYVPYMILPLYTSMTKIDQSLVEAAQDLGANTTKTLVRVLIPMSVPGISTGITMVFVPAVSTFVISRMLGGGSNLLIGDLIEMQFLGNSYNLNVGSAMSLVLMIIVLLCMSFTSSFDEDEIGGRVLMKTKHLRLMQRVYIILFFCFMYLPIAYMIVFSFNQSKGYSLFTGFTFKWYRSLFTNASILHALWVSVEVAVLSAIIATVLGTAASLGIASMSRKSRLLVTNITYIPVVNPEIITGISLMLLFVAYQRFATQSAWLPDNIMGLPTLLIAHIAFNVPYVIFNVSPKLKQLDIKLYEAALDLGCDPRQAFFKVILPEISPAILSAFLICLTYSIDDFMISYFNCGTVETLPIAIYSMTRKKVSPEIYALSTIMFVVILSVILVSNAMESRSYRRDQKTLRKEGAR